MASPKFLLMCKTSSDFFLLTGIHADSTISEVEAKLCEVLNIEHTHIRLLYGTPPLVLSTSNNNRKIKEFVKSGGFVIVENEDPVVQVFIKGSDKEFGIGEMEKLEVSSDTSCLFASVYFATHHEEPLDLEMEAELRKMIAEVVVKNPIKYNQLTIGMSAETYYNWIQDTTHRGGSLELSILSAHFGVEIVLIDQYDLQVHIFGENFRKRIFLMKNKRQLHLLVFNTTYGRCINFDTSEDHFLEMATDYVRKLKISRKYLDGHCWKCDKCNEYFFVEEDCDSHAKITKTHMVFINVFPFSFKN